MQEHFGISYFNLANILLGITLVVLFIRYLWIFYFSRPLTPVSWENALKTGNITARLQKMERRYRDRQRFFAWWLHIGQMNSDRVPGAFVELGVYKGDSAAVLHAMDPGRPLHLFDTFSGFPAGDLLVESGEAATYTPDNFADTSVDSVLKNISGNHNVIMHQGYFPDTVSGFASPVALVNMDLDLYNPTKAGLEFFYPLLSPGGIIFIHDYNYKWPGIIRAVDDFMTTIPENLIHLPDIDGTVMIIRNK